MYISHDEFQQARDRIRLELYAQFTTWTDILEEGVNQGEEAEAILSELARMRNASTTLPVDHKYFDVGIGFLKTVDLAREVLEGARSEIGWFGVVDNIGDIDARLHYICEQEVVTADRVKGASSKESKKLERKICNLKGRFLVIWTALGRFGK